MYIVVYEKTRKCCLFIGDNVEVFYVFSSHRKFLRVFHDFVFDGDRGVRVEEFDGDEKILCLTGRLTEFSDSELLNSTVIGVV